MCGITGFSWEDKSLIKKITKCISHRGPDSEGYFIDRGISLGHRRLSIIDLSPKGKQPMFNEDNNISIVFNGEIYNFKELKDEIKKKGHIFKSNSDTEVIIHGYEVYGEDIFSKLDGMFAIGLWDKKNKKLLIARDRIGKKPLYYALQENNIIFASEIKSILEAEVPRTINQSVLLETLSSRFSPGNNTVFSEIKKLPPGSYGVFSKGSLKIQSYWGLPVLTQERTPLVNEVDSLIESSVGKRLISDVPIGVLLSGGLDSSAIVSYMARKTNNIKTFSVGFSEGIDESKYARLVADHYSTDHKEIMLDKEILSHLPRVLWHLDEPISDPASLPTYLLCKEVSKDVKVALSGEGGDEVFGGYDTVNKLSFIQKLDKIPKIIRSNLMAPFLSALSSLNKYPKKQIYNFAADLLKSKTIEESYKKLYYFPFNKSELKDYTSNDVSDLLDKYIQKDDLYKSSIAFYFNEWLPNDLLMKVDKMSMANGLEIRAPFLDKDLIKYFFSIPKEYKVNKSLFKKTIFPHLPKEITNRKKQGFSLPISTWFTEKDFVDRVRPHIENLKARKIFNADQIDKLIKNPTIYRNDHKLWTLLNLELWYDLYIDKIPLEKVKI